MDWAFRRALNEARQQGELYFAGLLSEDRILSAFDETRWVWQAWIYTPAVTIWVFLSQCLSSDHSCSEAVARLIAWRLASGLKPCSAKTGAYCTARDGLPEEACLELMRHTGRYVDDQAPSQWLWCGRRVRVVDGSTITMSDTIDNQREYPQQPNQKPGCGFPIARILVVFSLAMGTVLDTAIGQYEGKQTGENSLFRALHKHLRGGDVVLADRYYSGWFDIALLHERGIDIVVRKHQLRPTDFRRGRRLGREDHLVCWGKPQRPDWMSKEQYAALPESLSMREVRIQVTQKGFRTQELVVVTTLQEAEEYSAADIAQLYRRRWQAELNLRSLKVVLQMDHLRSKTPHRIRNEFYIHLTAYNLIRQLMATAASQADVEPWKVSFKGTLQAINQLLPSLGADISTDRWCEALWEAILSHEVGNRPDRVEPRVKKRRPKEYDLMVRPRREYKQHVA